MRVGLFDSGIGGLTVLKTLIKKYPLNDYIYFGDTKNMPYGSKSIDKLKKLARQNVEFLLRFNVDVIVIACGTVSSNCLSYLKKLYDIKIIDIISPTINYLNNSNYNNILVMATDATINSHIFKNGINKNIYEVATPKLVPMIESNKLDNIGIVLEDYLSLYKNKIDSLVLGCTHYPLLKNEISNVIGTNVEMLDMSDLIVLDNSGNGNISIYFSKINDELVGNVKYILGKDIVIKEININ